MTTAIDLLHEIQKRIGVSRVSEITHLDRFGLPVVQCFRPLSKYPTTVFSGKGPTLELAKLSATMEAAESYWSERFSKVAFHGTYQEAVKLGHKVAPLASFILNEGVDWYAISMDWCEAFELEPQKLFNYSLKSTLVPIPLVAIPGDGTLIQRNTDGIAAGFDWQQAVLHGIQEVWERHCYSVALANCHAKALPLGILRHPDIQPLLDLAEQIGIPIFLKDISLEEVGLYCVYAVVFDQSAGFRLVNSGTGCALGLLEATRAALYEALQSRLVAIAGAREDIEHYVLEKNILNNDFNVFSYWYENFASPPESKYTLTSDFKNVEDSLLEVIRLISNSGFKVFFVPFTDESVIEKVGRIVIPGAEQWAGDRTRIGTRIAESLISLKSRILS